MDWLVWLGILLCITQAGIFSGLNLAFFSLSRLQLEVKAERGSKNAMRVLALRQDANFLLATILWGNVAVNVLLTLLSDSVLAGVTAFLFSTVLITLFGEIVPQAYFSRNALKVAGFFVPMIRFYQIFLYVVSKPTGLVLDAWLGKEGIQYFRETDLKAIIREHINSDDSEVEQLEGMGAINFLAIDDMLVVEEGAEIEAKSVIALPAVSGIPQIPSICHSPSDEFLKKVNASGETWVILTDLENNPLLLMEADNFIRGAIFYSGESFNPYHYCHRPLIVRDAKAPLGEWLYRLKIHNSASMDKAGVIEEDVILLWTDTDKRIITGADILGRLLEGVGDIKTA
ncbi:MAG: DUF21 domain-containing protein [Pseudomonadales bacterium]|nr:DUF21 domain-containing protein [Pseudomonadales bacterium]